MTLRVGAQADRLLAGRGGEGGRVGLSCGPALGQAHAFDGGALAFVQGGPGQSKRRVEVVPVLVAVAALVGGAAAAQAVHGGAARVVAAGGDLGLLDPVAPRSAAAPISRRRNRFGLDVQALSRRQGEI